MRHTGAGAVIACGDLGKSFDGAKVRDQLETITGFQGTTGVYNMSPTVHQGITVNPFLIAAIINGKVKVVQ